MSPGLSGGEAYFMPRLSFLDSPAGFSPSSVGERRKGANPGLSGVWLEG